MNAFAHAAAYAATAARALATAAADLAPSTLALSLAAAALGAALATAALAAARPHRPRYAHQLLQPRDRTSSAPLAHWRLGSPEAQAAHVAARKSTKKACKKARLIGQQLGLSGFRVNASNEARLAKLAVDKLDKDATHHVNVLKDAKVKYQALEKLLEKVCATGWGSEDWDPEKEFALWARANPDAQCSTIKDGRRKEKNYTARFLTSLPAGTAAEVETILKDLDAGNICQRCEIEDPAFKESPRIVVVDMRRVNVRGGARRNDPLACAHSRLTARARARKQTHAHSLKMRSPAFVIAALAALAPAPALAPSAPAAALAAAALAAARPHLLRHARQFDDAGLPAGRAAGEPLKIRLPGGKALSLCLPPGASADAVVRRAAIACGLAPSQLALFCGGRRLLGPAPLGQAGGVRGGGTLRVMQRLAGGAPSEAEVTAAFEQFDVNGDGQISRDEFVAALTRPGFGCTPLNRGAAVAMFNRCDANGDGVVSYEEFVALWTAPARPAHRPSAREVAVGEEEIAERKRFGGTELEVVLKLGAVALLDAQWMVELAARGGVLWPRQKPPDEAFLSLSEVQACSTSDYCLSVVCISHCWLQPDHPDPRGYNLRAAAHVLDILISKSELRIGVFLDFCSLHQNCRDGDGTPQGRGLGYAAGKTDAVSRFPAENDLFEQALGSLGTLYSHPHTIVFMMTAFPPDYRDPNRYNTPPGSNVKDYFDRGWCFCELSWAMMVKGSGLVLDLAKDTGEEAEEFDLEDLAQGRKAPVLPSEFVQQLKSKSFTNGKTDYPRVAELYKKGFKQRFGAATLLDYSALGFGWGDEEARAVARVLPHVPALETLDLNRNLIGDAGACALAEALPRALTALKLANNSIGDAGSRALSKALPRALKELDLGNNLIGAAGMRALAEALPRAPALKELILDGDPIGAAAKTALCTAWGDRGGTLWLPRDK